MYLVTTEAEDGSWVDDPEGFDSKGQAMEYIDRMRSALLPGNCLVLYDCEMVGDFNSGNA